MTDKNLVLGYLMIVRQTIGKRFVLADRRKNRDALRALGLDIETVKRIIVGLDLYNYSSGPHMDKSGGKGDVWVFGYNIKQTEIYIKIALAGGKDDTMGVVCISFHEADDPLTYPFRRL